MSTPAHGSADAITAALLQITQHAERLAVLDEREATHHQAIAARLAELARRVAKTDSVIGDIQATTTRQAGIPDSLNGLDAQVAAIASQLTDMTATNDSDPDEDTGNQYRPALAPRWWQLHGNEREDAIARLRAWVEQVYRPGYGHLAAALGPCWEQHPLCLYGLDWLMELWSALYLTRKRGAPILASQAEWQTRLLPALAEQMYIETTRCQHAQATQARGPGAVGHGQDPS